MRTLITTGSLFCLLTLLPIAPGQAAEQDLAQQVDELSKQGQQWLLSRQQDNGAFFGGEPFALGITELVTLGLLESGLPADHPQIAKALDYILAFKQEDGGIYNPEAGLGNYCTSIGLMVLIAANRTDPAVVGPAQQYLLGLQNTEGGINDGGIGYGSRGQGNEDLSNTSMAIEALRQSGLAADHPAMQRALGFVTRCQNLTSHNQLDWAQNGANDGSAVYSPDSSKAGGSYHDGHSGQKPSDKSKPAQATKLDGYASMTYALIKSYVYLALTKDDPRVKAALDWIAKNYQFDANPGLPPERAQQGLYYYYQTVGKTMDLLDQDHIQVDGEQQDWRADLFAAIKERATIDDAGARWQNDAERWAEAIPELATAYSLVSLARIGQALTD